MTQMNFDPPASIPPKFELFNSQSSLERDLQVSISVVFASHVLQESMRFLDFIQTIHAVFD